MQTVKNLVKKDGDPYLAMLSYRSTPLRCGFSAAELLKARKLRTTVPTTRASLKPAVPARNRLRESEVRYKCQQQSNYDHHHDVRSLAPLAPGSAVFAIRYPVASELRDPALMEY